jgi:hypothetical protein
MSDRELLCSSPVYIRGLIRSDKTKWIKSWVVEYSSAVLLIKNSSKLEIFNGTIQNRDQWINMQVNILWSPVQQSLKEIEVLVVLAAIEFTTEAYPDTMLWGTKTLVQKKKYNHRNKQKIEIVKIESYGGKPEKPEPVLICPGIFDKIANPIIEELMTC